MPAKRDTTHFIILGLGSRGWWRDRAKAEERTIAANPLVRHVLAKALVKQCMCGHPESHDEQQDEIRPAGSV